MKTVFFLLNRHRRIYSSIYINHLCALFRRKKISVQSLYLKLKTNVDLDEMTSSCRSHLELYKVKSLSTHKLEAAYVLYL